MRIRQGTIIAKVVFVVPTCGETPARSRIHSIHVIFRPFRIRLLMLMVLISLMTVSICLLSVTRQLQLLLVYRIGKLWALKLDMVIVESL